MNRLTVMIEFRPQTRGVTKDIKYRTTENQNRLFHTHKFNPKMLCHSRGWTVERRETKEKIKTKVTLNSRANKTLKKSG